jgi:hypothetical protein
MAVKAKAQITIFHIRDIEKVVRWYLLQSSTSAKPAKPTDNAEPGGAWSVTEPSYTESSTNTLYYVDQTAYSNGDLIYSDVQVSSAYEAAKQAYNKAADAQSRVSSVEEAVETGEPLISGTQTAATAAWTGVASFKELKDGQKILYWLPYAGASNVTLNLTLSDGTKTGAVNCYYGGTTRLGTHYPAGSMIRFTYRKNVTIGTDTTKYTGWWADANYDSGNTYDRVRYNAAVKAVSDIVAWNIIVGDANGYHHLKTGEAFNITYPILYAGSAISSGSTGTNNYTVFPFTVTTTQNVTLTAHKTVYIKGTLAGSKFTPVSTMPLTQTEPTSDDGYYYIVLGTAYSTTGIYLSAEHPIYRYKNGSFKSMAQIASETAAWAYDNNATYIDGGNLYAGTVTAYSIAAKAITAEKIDIDDLFSQNITATNLNITGGSINIETSSETSDLISLSSGSYKLKMMPYGVELYKNSTGIFRVNPAILSFQGVVQLKDSDGDTLLTCTKNEMLIGSAGNTDDILRISTAESYIYGYANLKGNNEISLDYYVAKNLIGTNGTTGYVFIAMFKVTSAWKNGDIRIHVFQRKGAFGEIVFRLTNASAASGYALEYAYTVGTLKDVFIYPYYSTDDAAYYVEVYINKAEANDSITSTKLDLSGYMRSGITVTYPGTQCEANSGWVKATPLGANVRANQIKAVTGTIKANTATTLIFNNPGVAESYYKMCNKALLTIGSSAFTGSGQPTLPLCRLINFSLGTAISKTTLGYIGTSSQYTGAAHYEVSTVGTITLTVGQSSETPYTIEYGLLWLP